MVQARHRQGHMGCALQDDGAFLLQVLNLSPPLATGLILVSCCPGGQVTHA